MNHFFKLPNLLKRASSLMLFEGAVVSIIKQHGGDYGLQKLFGTFGAVIFGPLSGVLIDFGHDYSGVIILYFCLRAATALCILKLDLNFKVIYFSWKLHYDTSIKLLVYCSQNKFGYEHEKKMLVVPKDFHMF